MMGEVRKRNLQPFRDAIARCFRKGRSRAAAVELFNSMVASHFQFNVLVLGGPIAETCVGIDLVVHNNYAHFFGLTKRDPTHKIWLKRERKGHGMRSVAVGLLQADLREHEVLLNKVGAPFNSLRSRLVAYPDDNKAQNFIHNTIREVSAYGFYPRNGHEPLHTLYLAELSVAARSHKPPLGSPSYRQGEKPPKNATRLPDALLGYGSPTHGHRFCLYGPIDDWIRTNAPNEDPVLRPDGELPLMCSEQYWRNRPTACPNIPPRDLALGARRALHRLRSEQDAQAYFLAWRTSITDPNPLTSTR